MIYTIGIYTGSITMYHYTKQAGSGSLADLLSRQLRGFTPPFQPRLGSARSTSMMMSKSTGPVLSCTESTADFSTVFQAIVVTNGWAKRRVNKKGEQPDRC